MNKESLTAEDKVRLSVLVSAYLNPPKESFIINGRGEVIMIKPTLLQRVFNKEAGLTLDFMEVTQGIVTKLMDEKGEIPYIAQLCGEGFGELIETNSRGTVIKKLYIAHLVEEQPKGAQRNERREQPKQVQITQRTSERMVPTRGRGDMMVFEKRPSNYQLSIDVAKLLNQVDEVFIVE